MKSRQVLFCMAMGYAGMLSAQDAYVTVDNGYSEIGNSAKIGITYSTGGAQCEVSRLLYLEEKPFSLVIGNTINDTPSHTVEPIKLSQLNYLSWTTTEQQASYDCCSKYVDSAIITANTITELGDKCFCQFYALESVTLPETLETIGNEVFSFCKGLKSIELPNTVTTIGYKAFYSCSKLTTVELPNSLQKIGEYAFQNCTELKSVYIGQDITEIGNFAFFGCGKISEFYINATTPPTISNKKSEPTYTSFPRNTKITIFVPQESLKKYEEWKDLPNMELISIVGYDYSSIKTIRDDNFKISSHGQVLTINSKSPVSIHDISGRMIKQFSKAGNHSLDLPKGIYIIKDKTSTVKIIH